MTAEYNADASLVPKCPRNRQQEGNKAEKYSTESEKAFQKRQVMLSKYSSSSIQLATKKEKEKTKPNKPTKTRKQEVTTEGAGDKGCSFFNTSLCLLKFTQKHMTGRGLSKKQAARDTGNKVKQSETKERSGKWMPWLRGEGVTQKRQTTLTARRKAKAQRPAAAL